MALCWPKQLTKQTQSPGKGETLPLDEMSQPHLKGFVVSCISLEKQLTTMIFKYVCFSSRLSPQIKVPVGIHFMFLVFAYHNTQGMENAPMDKSSTCKVADCHPHRPLFLCLFPPLCGKSLGSGIRMSRLALWFFHKQIGWNSRRNFIFL